jgi:hypothetical protein
MREPPLATPADLLGFRERFRLLVLPTFEPAFAYRIDVPEDGLPVLRWARLNGRGGYAPGALAKAGLRHLSAAEATAFKSELAAAALASLGREERDAVPAPDGSEGILMCADGTTVVFEHLASEGRSYLARSCGVLEEPLQRLYDTVSRLEPRAAMN